MWQNAGLDTGLALEALHSLQETEHIEIELNFISSHVHIARQMCLPGLLMSLADPMITLVSQEPRILLVENFLSAADCQVRGAVCLLACTGSHLQAVEQHADVICSGLS